MYINEQNFMIELNDAVNELVVIISELKNIKMDTPETHDRLLLLNGRFIHGTRHIEEIIHYIGNEKPDPSMVGTKLKDFLKLMGEVFREKTRIIKDTPPIVYQTNDFSSPN